jgi:hypothetical protein
VLYLCSCGIAGSQLCKYVQVFLTYGARCAFVWAVSALLGEGGVTKQEGGLALCRNHGGDGTCRTWVEADSHNPTIRTFYIPANLTSLKSPLDDLEYV